MPTAPTYVPGAQFDHGAQLAAFAVALKVPLGHAAHVRSVVLEPLEAIEYPGAHADHGVHVEAGFASWSQVPFAHACLAVAPPAQYVPTSQVVQTGGDVGVPAAVCSVPAAHAPADTQLAWFGDDE